MAPIHIAYRYTHEAFDGDGDDVVEKAKWFDVVDQPADDERGVPFEHTSRAGRAIPNWDPDSQPAPRTAIVLTSGLLGLGGLFARRA